MAIFLPFQQGTQPALSDPKSCHAPSSPPANYFYGTITSAFAVHRAPDSRRSLFGPQIPTIPAPLPAWMFPEPAMPLHFSIHLEQPPQFCTQQPPVPQCQAAGGLLVVKHSKFNFNPKPFWEARGGTGERWNGDTGASSISRSQLGELTMPPTSPSDLAGFCNLHIQTSYCVTG